MAERKIRIKGIGNLLLKEGDTPQPDKDYLISLRAALEKIEKDVQDSQNPDFTFVMRAEIVEQIMEIGTKKKIAVQKGKSPSQVLRFTIEDVARMKGIDSEQYYKAEMSKLINQYQELLK